MQSYGRGESSNMTDKSSSKSSGARAAAVQGQLQQQGRGKSSCKAGARTAIVPGQGQQLDRGQKQ